MTMTEWDKWKASTAGQIVLVHLEQAVMQAFYAGSMAALQTMSSNVDKIITRKEQTDGRISEGETGTGRAETGSVRAGG